MATIVPIVAKAEEHPYKYDKRYYDNRRYFDRAGGDYHVWNEGEDRAYRFYLNDQHLGNREWRRLKYNDQAAYFQWRHNHPDSVIFAVK
jgi:hypothetical protein